MPRTRIALALVTVSAFTAAALGSACAELVGIGDLPGPVEAGNDASTDSTTEAAGDAEDASMREDAKKPIDAGRVDASGDSPLDASAGDSRLDASAGDASDERGDGDGTLGQVLPAHTPLRPGRDGQGRDRVTLDLGEIKLHVWQT